MMKKLLLIPLMVALSACVPNKNVVSPKELESQISEKSEERSEENSEKESELVMKLYIDEQELDVSWLNNPSTDALKELAKNTLTINMHEYGGFEQTGSIGSAIVRNDSQINTEPGDIVLYNGNTISVFYEPSSWSYTRLGHINMNKNELNTLLNKDAIVFVLEVK